MAINNDNKNKDFHITYRQATLDDLKEVYTVADKARNVMYSQNIIQWTENYPVENDFRKDILKKELFIGLIDNKIAVMYVINLECDEEYKDGKWADDSKSYLVLHRFCVNPDFQNMGVGLKALMHIQEHLKSMGYDALRLDAYSKNPYAIKVYTKAGYKQVGIADFDVGRFYLFEKYF